MDDTWPNRVSQSNSDEWLVEHHDRIRVMRPRVLVLNFVNGLEQDEARRKAEALIAAIREASRWHGYSDPSAPPFLEYEIAKIADLRDPEPSPDLPDRNSSLYPRDADGLSFEHSSLFTAEY